MQQIKKITAKEAQVKRHTLQEAWVSNAIEGIHVSPHGKRMVEDLVMQGKTSDEVVAAIKKDMGIK